MSRGANKGFYVDMDRRQLEKSIRKLALYQYKKKENIKEIVKETSQDVRKTSKQLVAVDEGETRRSIKTKYFNDGLAATTGPRLSDGWKAHWLEFGVYNVLAKRELPARPFMTPAAEQHRPLYLRKIARELGDLP